MKRIMKNILFPNKIIGFFLFNFSMGLLIYVFGNHLEETWIAYISYVLSFYALVIFCIWFYKACKFSNEVVKKSKLYHAYQNNFLTVTKTSIYLSLIFNLIYGILRLWIGVTSSSWWFITLSFYYLLLCFIRTNIVRNINNHKKEYQKLKHTGIILLLMNLVLIGIIILIITQNQIINYHGFLIYLVALYDFYFIIRSIINVLKYRKNHSPMIAASKCINLTVAMVSMISLATSMIYQFGDNDSNFKAIMISSMGLGIFFINSFMAIYMIVRANKNLKNDG